MLLRSAGLLFLFAVRALSDELSCDFRRPCCWQSLDEDTKWQIRSGRSININEFRRTFLVGRSRQPPVGNYLLHNGHKGHAAFGSCPFCSSDGIVNVQYRHWQSPAARLKVCWNRWGQSVHKENCHAAEPSRQSQVINQRLVVPAGANVQVRFIMEKVGKASPVVMIDRILMNVKRCGKDVEHSDLVSHTVRIAVPAAQQTNEKSLRSDISGKVLAVHSLASSSKADLPQIAVADKRFRMRSLNREYERGVIRQMLHDSMASRIKESRDGEVSRQVKTVSARPAGQMASTGDVPLPPSLLSSLAIRRIPKPPPKRFIPDVDQSKELFGATSQLNVIPPPSPPAKPKDFDPLTDLLGKELVEFLDPNYVTKDDDEEEEDYDDKKQMPIDFKHSPGHSMSRPSSSITYKEKQSAVFGPTLVQTPHPLMLFHRPLSFAPPEPCDTAGGCLFDMGMCSYTHPLEVPLSHQFSNLRVGMSNFIRARIPPGSSSVVQTETNMAEPHTVFFDALEWKPGTRLIGCCGDANGGQRCPYATPSEAGVMLWQSASFDCPAHTVFIRFICENFGPDIGECGIDSVRLHKLSDTFLLEPCQKNLLSSL